MSASHAEFKRAVADLLARQKVDLKERTHFVRDDRAAIAEIFRVCRNALGKHRVNVVEVLQNRTRVQTRRLNATYRGVDVVVEITTAEDHAWAGYQ